MVYARCCACSPPSYPCRGPAPRMCMTFIWYRTAMDQRAQITHQANSTEKSRHRMNGAVRGRGQGGSGTSHAREGPRGVAVRLVVLGASKHHERFHRARLAKNPRILAVHGIVRACQVREALGDEL